MQDGHSSERKTKRLAVDDDWMGANFKRFKRFNLIAQKIVLKFSSKDCSLWVGLAAIYVTFLSTLIEIFGTESGFEGG